MNGEVYYMQTSLPLTSVNGILVMDLPALAENTVINR